jgi:general secretion pathway protein D
MDQVDENSMDVFVYYVENGSARELTDILRQIYGGRLTTETDSDRRSAGKTGADSGSQKIVQAQSDAASTEAASYSGRSVPSVAGDLIDDITIIADETNNAIVFKANPNDYFMIQKILEKLDILPRQVLLNVVVAEVSHNNSSELGVQWKLNAGIGDYQAAAMSDINDSLISTATGLGSMNGFSLGLFNAADALKALVKAVGTDSKLNILSSPNIIGVDNKEAKIEVTQDIPVISGSQVTSDGAVTNTIEYKTTGIILTATPSINSRGLVKLDLVQEVSEVGSFDTNTGNYPILSRRATTSLVVENEQTIFIGGMMRENSSVSNTGVPILKDIPGLGYLFKQKKTEGTKTELIFLITPHVIQSKSEADEITQEFTNKISQVKRLIAD